MRNEVSGRSLARPAVAVVVVAVAGLAGCAQHVTQDQLDEAVTEVRSEVESQGERVDRNEGAIEELRRGQEQLRQDLEQLREDFDARIQELEDRMVLSLPVHFEFDRAEVRPVDEPVLDRFAATVRGHLSEGRVTVEGFADRAGSEGYNRELSRERARSVRDYLVEEGGLSAERVRAVGYGESRLINEQTGPGRSGIENRRVTFVVEFAGQVGG